MENIQSKLMNRRLLVPIDFSEHSDKTVECATQLASLTGATIRLLHVFQIPVFAESYYRGLYLTDDQIKRQVEAAESEANEQLSRVASQLSAEGINVTSVLRPGYAFEEIVSAAKELEVDLIIIGSHGHTGFKRLLLGSTAERVVQYAPCSVLVVKDHSGGSNSQV
jgi:universal stress protein A